MAGWPCVVLAASMPAVAETPASGTHYLIVRHDDYGPRGSHARVSAEPELETRLFALFERHGAKIIVGVVPFPLDGSDNPEQDPSHIEISKSWLSDPGDPWRELFQRYVNRGVVEPALHGFEHRRRTLPGHRPGEFRGQPFQWQRDVVRLGRDALAAVIATPVRIFIPPWNAWDANTVLALEESGFEWLSADLHHADYPATRVRHAPQCGADPREVLELLRTGPEVPSGSIVVLVTHPFDFEGKQGEAYFHALDELLATVQSSSDWTCVGLGGLPDATSGAWERRFRLAVTWHHNQRFLQDAWGPPLLFRPQPVLYAPTEWYRTRLWPCQLTVALTILVSAAIGWIVSRAIARHMLRSRRLVWGAALLSGAALVVLLLGAAQIAEHGYGIRGIRWQAIAAATGSTLALGWAVLVSLVRQSEDSKLVQPMSNLKGERSRPMTTQEKGLS